MLIVKNEEYKLLRKHGEETYPHECCGVLIGTVVGDRRTVRRIVRCGNARADRLNDRYTIDPKELIAAQREARRDQLDIVGFYHSHPDHPAQWSSTDLAEAHWFGCSYVITAVEKGHAAQTNSFALLGSFEEEKRFEVENINVVTDDEEEEVSRIQTDTAADQQRRLTPEAQDPERHRSQHPIGESR